VADHKIGGTVQQGPPKPEAGERQVTLDKHTIQGLASHWARSNNERLAAGSTWNDSGFVFTDDAGNPLLPEYAVDPFQLMAVEAGPTARTTP
jgi:hypothetical protein